MSKNTAPTALPLSKLLLILSTYIAAAYFVHNFMPEAKLDLFKQEVFQGHIGRQNGCSATTDLKFSGRIAKWRSHAEGGTV